MTRRRLVLAACVTVVILGAAWLLFRDGLSAQERLLVGTWQPKKGTGKWTFGADRTCQLRRRAIRPASSDPIMPTGYFDMSTWHYDMPTWHYDFYEPWTIRGGEIVIDLEMSTYRRAVRAVARLLGKPRVEPLIFVLESVSAEEIVIVQSDGTREVWTRDRGD